jgi:hypothetical protein
MALAFPEKGMAALPFRSLPVWSELQNRSPHQQFLAAFIQATFPHLA